jgi:hypothetical protein
VNGHKIAEFYLINAHRVASGHGQGLIAYRVTDTATHYGI